jgi:hypothetical protein
LVSDTPFASTDLALTIAQSGVSDFAFNRAPTSTQRVEVNRTARHVRVQLSGTNYLAIAEVEIFSPGEVFQTGQQVTVAATGLIIENRQVITAANVDGDAYDLSTEYALGTDPYTASPVGVLTLTPGEQMDIS